MNLLYSVAFEQNVFVYIFLTLMFCFDAMALLAWWSAPEVFSSENVNNNEQSHFVHMLHNTTDSSNSEVLIMFCGQFAINNLVHDEDLSYTIF